uniref:Uncharacterized protein n=1 Tax=Dipterocladia arabiensis TaxID=2007176 RepID=A0A1Z1M0B2_9FLOR|nr:hypothetical protein [Dipterocladia arabiensis]ARW59478.1 hypothetical protein [Dipterocladia arabiensis]
MQNKLYLINKINLLLISIEALDSYSYKYFYEYQQKVIKNNKIKIYKNYNDYKFYNLLNVIKYIFVITQIIKTKKFQNLVSNIIIEYNNCIQSNLIKRYLNKFAYIYHKIYYCYEYSKNINHLDTNKLAMINLYIMIQMNQKKGIIILIKYLYKYLK